MESPRHCALCSTLFADDSGSEICPACQVATRDSARQGNTPAASPRPPVDAVSASVGIETTTDSPNRFLSTVTAQPHEPLTGTGDATDLLPILGLDGTAEFELRSRKATAPPGYELIRRLGAGGMGDVYLAREIATERILAIKFLQAVNHSRSVERFLTEVRALARITDTHIVRILATDFSAAIPYYTMEYVADGNFADRVKAEGPLAVAEAAQVVAIAARAVHAAHRADVLHRDLKPRNILRMADGSPKVADFGLAKLTDRNDELTAANSPLGTPSFMPPEQVSRSHGEVGPASDVYGLGATLYYLLSGRPPFMGDSSAAIAAKVVSECPQRLRMLRAEVPGGLEGIVAKCLEKDPKDRYPTALALAEDLERFLAGRKQEAPELTRWRRSRLWVRRNSLRIAAVCVAVLAAIGVLSAGHSPKTSDPVTDARKTLKNGQSVTLIGPTGLPAYWRSVFEPLTLGLSTQNDETCHFQAMRYALLELFPNPGIEHYRVDLELRRLGGRFFPSMEEQEKIALSETDWFGFYFGYRSRPIGPAEHGHLMLALIYADYPPPLTPSGEQPLPAVWLQTTYFRQVPNELLDPICSKVSLANFQSSYERGKPGAWRPISVEVEPGRLIVKWEVEEPKTGAKKMVNIADYSRDKIDMSEKWRRRAGKDLPEAYEFDPWSPDLPFGLISFKTALSVRNVVITPLP